MRNRLFGSRRVIVSILAIAAILFVGLSGMVLLSLMRKPPAEIPNVEKAARVHALRVQPEDVQVVITGYGELRAMDVVDIASEVSGKVVEVYPNLEVGNVVPAGELLFAIDQRTYQAQVDQAKAQVDQLRNSIERVRTQLAVDQKRLETSARSHDLAQAEYLRVKNLFENDQVGTQSGVDTAERAYNAAKDQLDQMERALALYPIQLEELGNSLASAEAALDIARINLERTRVFGPFDGRITWIDLEKDQYAAPGARVVTLANDSILEISVPLDSRDARKWLQFNSEPVAEDAAWFNSLERVTCSIKWTEDRNGSTWNGTLDRVEQFDPRSRTLTVAVRMDGKEAASQSDSRLPLVAGMFCAVEIPGRMIEDVYRLPRWAVSFENTAYVSINNRLQTVPVEVSWSHGDFVFVSSGLESGDIVVTTRLVNPLENTLLDVTFDTEEARAS